MRNPSLWRCPGCGSRVALPADVSANAQLTDTHRLDQLAQALCGCWVVKLSSGGVSRLLGAIMAGDEYREDRKRRAVSGGGR